MRAVVGMGCRCGWYVINMWIKYECLAGDWVVDEGLFVGKEESEEETRSPINLALYPKTAPQQLHSNQASETTSINGHYSTS
jgi:hypothetical protein